MSESDSIATYAKEISNYIVLGLMGFGLYAVAQWLHGTDHPMIPVNFPDMEPHYRMGDILIALNCTQTGEPTRIVLYDNVAFRNKLGNLVVQHVVEVLEENGVEKYLVQGTNPKNVWTGFSYEAKKRIKLNRRTIVGRIVKVYKTHRWSVVKSFVESWETKRGYTVLFALIVIVRGFLYFLSDIFPLIA